MSSSTHLNRAHTLICREAATAGVPPRTLLRSLLKLDSVREHGSRRRPRPFSDHEEWFIQKHYRMLGPQRIAEKFDRSPGAITNKAVELGVIQRTSRTG